MEAKLPPFPWLKAALWGGITAAAMSLAIGWRNYYVYREAGRGVPLWEGVAGEVPIWFGWLALVPVIARLERRWPPTGARTGRHLLLHLLLALLLSAVIVAFTIVARVPLPNTPSPANVPIGSWNFAVQVYAAVAFSFVFVYASILGLAIGWNHHIEQQLRATRESRLQTVLARAQRDLLRSQLHPHFLFNTMHAISALMGSDVTAARQMMTRLSDLLRQTLDESAGHEVTLDEELELLRKYVDIQMIRFQDRLTVRYEIAQNTTRLLIPRLILQPIVENAIVHGLGPVERPVTITVAAARSGDDLQLSVHDDGAGLSRRARFGIGLSNSRARLHQLYGSGARLTVRAATPTGTTTMLMLPAHTEPAGDGSGDAPPRLPTR